MAYVSEWERLSDALACVMTIAGHSKDEAQTDICRAIADRAVRIRVKLRKHTTRHLTASDTVLEGRAFEVPTQIQPKDLDWESSRPIQPWTVRRGAYSLPGSWELEWIELSRSDVTNILCPTGKEASPPIAALGKKSARNRTQPERERAQRAIKELFPGGTPDQAAVPNAILCGRVGEKLKRDGLRDVSDDTILRAAGRRK